MKAPLVAYCGTRVGLATVVACGGATLLGDSAGPSRHRPGDVIVEDAAGPVGDDGTSTLDETGKSGLEEAGTPVDAVHESGGMSPSTTAPSCGNTQFDPHNCGACGNDCTGGACQAGACVPLPPGVLASGQLTPSSIVVDATNVYWINEGYVPGRPASANVVTGPMQVMKCAKSGCNNNPTILRTGVGSSVAYGNLRGLAVDSTNVYFGSGTGDGPPGVYFCPIAGCNGSTPLLLKAVTFGAIAVNGDKVYAIGAPVQYAVTGAVFSPWQVYGCSIHGCDDAGQMPLWSAPEAAYLLAPILGLATDGTNAYFANDISLGDGGIQSCALSGCDGSPAVLARANFDSDAGPLLPWQFAVDQISLYWDVTRYQPNLAGPPAGQVLACAKSGCGESPTVLASGLRNPAGLTTDGVNVYFAERGDTTASNAREGRVAKCSVTGCSNQPTEIAINLSYPHGVAVDDSHIYWTDLGSAAEGIDPPSFSTIQSADGRIMIAPK